MVPYASDSARWQGGFLLPREVTFVVWVIWQARSRLNYRWSCTSRCSVTVIFLFSPVNCAVKMEMLLKTPFLSQLVFVFSNLITRLAKFRPYKQDKLCLEHLISFIGDINYCVVCTEAHRTQPEVMLQQLYDWFIYKKDQSKQCWWKCHCLSRLWSFYFLLLIT